MNINGIIFNQTGFALLDIGSSFLYGPPEAVEILKEEINKVQNFSYDSSGYYYINCTKSDIEKFPKFQLSIDNYPVEITPQSYLFYEDGMCYLFVANSGSNYWILGQVFFREYYTYYDMDNKQVTLFKALSKLKSESYFGIFNLAVMAVGLFGLLYIISVFRQKSVFRSSFYSNYSRIY